MFIYYSINFLKLRVVWLNLEDQLFWNRLSMVFESLYSRRVVFSKSGQVVTIQETIQRVAGLATCFDSATQKPWDGVTNLFLEAHGPKC